MNKPTTRTTTKFAAAITMVLIMAFAAAMTVSAQSETPDWKLAPTGLTLAAGDQTGELDLTWDPHPQTSKTLLDYRVTWTPDGEAFRPNSEPDWYAYPTTNEVTVTGLDPGQTYQVRVRARYDDNRKSGWSDVQTGDAAEAPEEDKNQDEGSATPRGPGPDEDEDPAPNVAPRSTHPTTPVAYAWSLRPSGLEEDDEFRLIFISSQKRNAGPTSISTYNSWIQSQAGSGHTDIRTHRNGFRAVVCTEDDDARQNTAMDHTTVVPVYWLGGAKVADSYNDFYDGSWDNDTNTKDRTEDGINELDLTLSGNEPWTGCEDDGTEAFSSSNVSQALGKDPARLGRPGLSGAGNNPLSSNTVANRNTDHTMYGISAVFKIDAPRLPARPGQPDSGPPPSAGQKSSSNGPPPPTRATATSRNTGPRSPTTRELPGASCPTSTVHISPTPTQDWTRTPPGTTGYQPGPVMDSDPTPA